MGASIVRLLRGIRDDDVMNMTTRRFTWLRAATPYWLYAITLRYHWLGQHERMRA